MPEAETHWEEEYEYLPGNIKKPIGYHQVNKKCRKKSQKPYLRTDIIYHQNCREVEEC